MTRIGMSLMPPMEGFIDRRVLISLRVELEVAARLIPRPLQPRVVNGWCVAGVCLVRLARLRPAGMPGRWGLGSENCAYRFAVRWLDAGRIRDGVYIPGRVTDSPVNAVVGGRLFPGVHHLADFEVRESAQRLRIGFRRRDAVDSLKLAARVVDEWPAGSVFATKAAASEFHREGAIGWSPSHDGACLEGLRLDCQGWETEPLFVERFESTWFQNRDVFPPGSVEFDSGLLMRNVRHTWRSLGGMKVEVEDAATASAIR